MAGLLIPDDWDEPTDGFCTLTVTIPNSVLWKAAINGALYGLTLPANWDDETGDPDLSAQIADDAYNSIGVVCP